MTKFGDLTRDEKLALFGAWLDGSKIELRHSEADPWHMLSYPAWDENCYYRIQQISDSINWDHVAPQFKFMARDKGGSTWLYRGQPRMDIQSWAYPDAEYGNVTCFASYKKGTVDWKDSLVERPL